MIRIFASQSTKHKLLFFAILIIGTFFRFTGLNWDSGQHLHPDERFLTIVATNMRWPDKPADYFNTGISPLNPHNIEHAFYVYGTYPVILVKTVAAVFNQDNYGQITQFGRFMSAVTDLITLLFVFLIARKISGRKKASLWAMFLYASCALSMQMSRFFTVDPYLTLFATIAIYLIVSNKPGILLGVSTGLAISAKISGVLLLVPIGLYFLYQFIEVFKGKNKQNKINQLRKMILLLIIFIFSLLLSIRVFYPYLFSRSNIWQFVLNQKVLDNWKELSSFTSPQSTFPPSVQWLNTTALIFPLIQAAFTGLGMPLFITALLSFVYLLTGKWRDRKLQIILLWIAAVFAYQGIQTAKALRYFYPVFPALAVISGLFIDDIFCRIKNKYQAIYITSVIILFISWPLMVLSIYLKPHTRIAASEWMYKHIPQGAKIAGETWDDMLPLPLGNQNSSIYESVQLPLTDPDSDISKWQKITNELETTDYLLLTSNRDYGSMTHAADKFPITNKYYQLLFNGSLGFEPVAQFTSRPNLPLPIKPVCIRLPLLNYGIIARQIEECSQPGISIIDDYAEELWTVYDHPKVIIFRKTISYNKNVYLNLIYGNN